VGRNVTTADAVAAAGVAAATALALRKGRMRNHQEYDERSKKFMHCSSAKHERKGDAAKNHAMAISRDSLRPATK